MRFAIGLLRRVLILALVLAIPLVAGELIARRLITDAVTSAVRDRIGADPRVSLGSSPILPQLIRGSIDTATVRATGARIGGLPPLTLTATLRDVHVAHLTSLQGAIGRLRVDARLAPPAVREMVETPTCLGSLPPGVRGALTSAPRVLIFPGRIDLLPPSGRATEVRLRPAATPHAVVLEPSGVEEHGSSAPGTLALARAQTRCTRALADLPFGVSLVSASARIGILSLEFIGTDATFSALR